jgi:accessory colonization factor AcfC
MSLNFRASIKHNARDGVVRHYGGVYGAGPEPTWSKKAQADADILWGTAEENMTALLESYKNFSWDDVTPI